MCTSQFSHETLQFSDPVSKLGDFVNVWIITDRGIIDFVNAEAGLMVVADERQRTRMNEKETHQAELDAPRARSLPITLNEEGENSWRNGRGGGG